MVKKKKIVISILIVLLGVFATESVLKNNLTIKSAQYSNFNASITEDGRFEYTELVNGTIEITKYVGTDTAVTIPETIDGKGVTSIGYSAFSGCSSLTNINIPEGVISIGINSFYGCSSLTEITIPSSITSINVSAFSWCSSLTRINVNTENEKYISVNGVLFNKNMTEIICYPPNKEETTYTIQSGIITIGDGSFKGCSNLTEIIIPEEVRSIGKDAFWNCGALTQITLPSNLKSIGYNAFSGCSSLTQIIIPSSVTKIRDYTFSECSSLISINIPEGVTSIGKSAFSKCKNLTEIEIPSSVISIADSVFLECLSLTKINVEKENEKYISVDGVLFNKNITEIICYPVNKEETTYTIPSGIINIKESAFSKCSKLTDIIISEGVTCIEYNAFSGCSSVTKIIIPPSVTSIGGNAFSECSALTDINIPEGVASIASSTFKGCNSLTKITIPSSIASIGNWAFSKCSSLTDINIPEGVKSIEYSAFKGCNSLIKITIPSSVAYIGEYAFSECSSLTNINIPEGVTHIERQSFWGCSALTKITLPSSLTSIGTSAFTACTSLAEIEIPVNVTHIEKQSFWGCSALTKITLPASLTSIGESAFVACRNLAEIEIPVNITHIEKQTFWGCNSLAKVTIPASVTSIGIDAFVGSDDNIIIYCKSNTYAEEYAVAQGISYIVDDISPTAPTDIEFIFENSDKYSQGTWTNKDVYVTRRGPSGSMDEGTGVALYEISVDNENWETYLYTDNNSMYVFNTEGRNIRYFRAVDKVGNVSETISRSVLIDKTEPEILSITGNETYWTKENVTLIINGAKDNLSGLAENPYSFDGGETWQKENTKTYTQNTSGIVIKVKDKTQNTRTYQEEINITNIIKPTGIKITTQPNKREYKAYENFETEGMKIEIVYDNGTAEETKDYTIINGRNLTCQVSNIEIQYNKNQEMKVQVQIKVLHDMTEATCTEDGKCKVEECKYKEEALGHSFTNYISDENATCTEDGTKTAKCDKCDTTDTISDEGSIIPHDYENGTCTMCGEKELEIEVTYEKYNINNGYISKVQAKTTVKEFKEQLKTNATEINIYNKEGELQEDNEILGTGMEAELKLKNESVIFIISVAGDTNGDKKVDFFDMLVLNQVRLNKRKLEGEYFLSGDIFYNGKIEFLDLLKINKYRLNKVTEL